MKLINKIKQQSITLGLPIIDDHSLEFIIKIIKNNQFYNVLEVGTAIGFSAISIASVNPKIIIDTIEKNQNNFLLASKNLEHNSQIKVFNNDVLDFDLYQNKLRFQKYDLIFLDGPKKSLSKQFNYFFSKLKNKSIIIIDNVFLNKIRLNSAAMKLSSKTKIIKAIDKFVSDITTNKKLNSKVINIGDGLLLVWKGDLKWN